MKIVLIDDDQLQIEIFTMFVGDVADSELVTFNNPIKALEYIIKNPVDVVFCDIEMPNINGIETAKQIKQINPDISIVFETSHEEFALNAFDLDAIGYLVKPFTKSDILTKIEKARRIIPKPQKESKRVNVRTFGNFDIFVDGNLLTFPRAKAKEFLAVLVDRKGGLVSTNEMISYLFEDEEITESLKSNYRNIRCALQAVLAEHNIDNIVTFTKGGASLNSKEIDCDYYEFLKGNEEARSSFTGEYMTNYSWSEDTLAYLLNQ